MGKLFLEWSYIVPDMCFYLKQYVYIVQCVSTPRDPYCPPDIALQNWNDVGKVLFIQELK